MAYPYKMKPATIDQHPGLTGAVVERSTMRHALIGRIARSGPTLLGSKTPTGSTLLRSSFPDFPGCVTAGPTP
jgi:hypothetical protein